MSAATYTINQICEMTGVSRRTVRYYVQEGLLQPPVGRGRGGNYLDSHVERLCEIRSLQERGWTLSSIERYLAAGGPSHASGTPSPSEPPEEESVDRTGDQAIEEALFPALEEKAKNRLPHAAADSGVRRTVRTTFSVAPGVEIVVDRDVEESLSRKIQELVRIAATILSGKE